MGVAILWLFNTLIELVTWAVIISAVLSWLFAFNVINGSNAFVASVARTLDAITDPLLRPIRKILPPLGGIDLSPIVLILGLQFIRIAVNSSPLVQNLLSGF